MKQAVTQISQTIERAVAPVKEKKTVNPASQQEAFKMTSQLLKQWEIVRRRYSIDHDGGGYTGL